MIRISGTTATVCVSGPLRDGAVIDLSWNRAVSAVTSKDSTVEVLSTGASVKLRITPGTLAARHRVTLTLG
jgi:hyaluronate lyase